VCVRARVHAQGGYEVFMVPEGLEEEEVAEALAVAGPAPGGAVFAGSSDEEEEVLQAQGRACR